ncbi:MAG: hypothetical protein WCB12_03695 [Bryobacteraceae bacterium]
MASAIAHGAVYLAIGRGHGAGKADMHSGHGLAGCLVDDHAFDRGRLRAQARATDQKQRRPLHQFRIYRSGRRDLSRQTPAASWHGQAKEDAEKVWEKYLQPPINAD